MFLTDAELMLLTGYRRHSCQRRALEALLGHTTRAMSDRYIKGRRVVRAEPVRKKL